MTTQHPFRTWRRGRDLTLEACADQLGVTLQHLGKVETRKVNPSVDLVAKMAALTKNAVTKEQICAFATDEIA